MKNYTITEEQIKKISTQDQIVEDYLNEWFPEAFKKELQIGKWYIVDGNKCGQSGSILLAVFSGHENKNYGINFRGDWSTDLSIFHDDLDVRTRLATDKEIQHALIKQAEKRGFKKGSKVNASIFGDQWYKSKKMESSNFTYDESINQLCLGNYAIFKNGIWAEVFNQKYLTKKQAEAKLTELSNDGCEYKIID